MGFVAPSARTNSESPRLSIESTLGTTKSRTKISPAGPTPLATVSLSGFFNLSATLLLSLPPYHFQEGGTHGVAPFRDLFLSRSLQQLVAAEIPS
jgi:hypothetical protein